VEVFCQSENSSLLTPIVLQNWSGGKDIIKKYAKISKLVHFIVKKQFHWLLCNRQTLQKGAKKII
jgi:hypothetical protein